VQEVALLSPDRAWRKLKTSGAHDELGNGNELVLLRGRADYIFIFLTVFFPIKTKQGTNINSSLLMKNLMSFFALTTLLIFASCSKEAIIQPETIAVTNVETVNSSVQNSEILMPFETTSHAQGDEINVTVVSQSADGVDLVIDFTSSHDFTDGNIESTQTIDFTDAKGDPVTLTFGVNSFSGGNGTLNVNLAIGGDDLSGLGMKTTQIITEDIAMD